jgi:hypothetical protein
MAYKLGKVERDVVELNELADRRLDEAAGPTAPREETPV